jgi:signal transduction histidine kinase/ActR/RegA family two-component response regulator
MSTRVRNIIRRYAVALLLTGATAAAQLRVGALPGDMAPFLAVPAVVGAVWFGGVGPGALATIITLAMMAGIAGPRQMIDTGRSGDVMSVGLFVLTALLICVTMRQLRRYAREERRRRMDLEHLLRRKTMSEGLAAALSVARTPADVTNACTTELMYAVGATTGAVAVLDRDEGDAKIVQTFGYEQSIAGRFSLSSTSPLAAAMRSGELVCASAGAAPRNGRHEAEAFWERHEGFVIIPLMVSARPLGAVLLGFDRPHVFEDDEREDLREAGQLAARALERAQEYESAERARVEGEAFRVRAEAELRERRRAEEAHRESEARYRTLAARTHRLYSLSAVLSEAVTLDAVARAVVRQGRSVVGAAAGTVALRADEDVFETLYSEEYPQPVVEAWHRFAAEPGLCATKAIATRKPVLVGSFAEWQQQYPRSAATAADGGFTSAAALPLLVDNVPIGVLSFHFTVPVNFDAEYQALLTSVAHHAAQAIDRARLYETTQHARVEAETANRAKDDFLSIVSHELRTPLNAILGWGTMLRNGSLDSARIERATDAIVNNAMRQAHLVDDLLEVSRIVAGRVSLDLQELQLADVVRGAVEAMLPTAAQREVELRIGHLPNTRVVADPHRLEQVFGNLFANAVKFTPAGGQVMVDGAVDNGIVRVRVVDTGCGIEPEALPHVFERFRQGNNTTTRSVGGLGLGLFIVRRLVEALGGEVFAESAGKGAGATFTVALPVSAASDMEQVSSAHGRTNGVVAETDQASLSAVHVLVVDDEADAREMVTSALELRGAKVSTARCAREALDQLTTSEPPIQVMLADLAMPEEDGYSLIRHVRTHPNALVAHVPAAAVTACAREDERQRALAAGFDLHLAKPIAPAVLIDAVARLATVGANA